jgi:O-antigen/teichoic acid export membrane protein
LSDRLEPEGYGLLILWTNTAMLGGLILGEWLNKGSAYAVGRGAPTGRVAGNALMYGLGLGGVLLAGSWLAQEGFSQLAAVRGMLLAGLVGLMILQKAAESMLLGQERIRAYSLLPLLFICCYAGGSLLVLGVWKAGLDGILRVWLLSVAVAAATGWVLLLRGGGPLRVDREVWGQMREVGGRGALSVTLVFLLFRSDLYLVKHFLDASHVGVYRVAGIFAEMMQRLPNVAGAVLLPKVIQGQEGESSLSLRVARNILLFSLLCALGLAAAGPLLIGLFFPKYPGAYAPLLWMLPGLVVAGFGSVFNTRLAGQGYPPIALWAPALALALNVALNLLLIPALGLVGAALSTSLAYGLWGLLATGRCLRQLGCGWGAFLRGAISPPSITSP